MLRVAAAAVQHEGPFHLEPHDAVERRPGLYRCGEVAPGDLGKVRDHLRVVERRVWIRRRLERLPDLLCLTPVGGMHPGAEGTGRARDEDEAKRYGLEKGRRPAACCAACLREHVDLRMRHAVG
jgi:hypothetical protein